jgi:DNA polymerase I
MRLLDQQPPALNTARHHIGGLSHDLDRFEEIVLIDFEFNGAEGNRPNVVCLVAHELRSGRQFHLWHDQLGAAPPYRIDNKTLFVAFYASAELCCHLALGWPLPVNILDLFAEFRCLTNSSNEHQHRAGLLDAMDYFKLDSIDARAKEQWRDIVLRGGPWSAEERTGILEEYCVSDVECLEKLLPVMPLPNLAYALLRGSYMRADAWMRHRGIPLDHPLAIDLTTYWPQVRQALIDDLNTRYPFFEGASFRKKLLGQWIDERGIKYWPHTPTGQLSTDADTLRAIAERCPEAAEFCHTKVTLDQLKTFNLAVGDDGRNRCMLSAFRSKTGRNQPSNSAFAFGLNAAFRSLIKPQPGQALVYLDFSGQEFALAAYFSGDRDMIAAYESGDPYAGWARKAGAMPANGNKDSHPLIRAMFKRASLGVLYGMGEVTLSGYVGVSVLRARELLRSHHEAFPQFWRWSAAVEDAGTANRELQTVYGWRMRVLRNAKPGTLANYPMQGNGAEMLRLACCLAVEAGIPIVAPVHDAILIEGPDTAIEDITARMIKCMVAASRHILGGPAVRVDASKPLRFPDRYVDGRNTELWDLTMRLLATCKNGERHD